MLKFIIIAIIFTIAYILLAGLMNAAGKSTPVIPDIKNNEDENNDD